MTQRILGPSGGKRRRRLLLLLPLVALAALFLAIGASATLTDANIGFQASDGNLDPNNPSTAPNFDWNSFATVTWSPHPATTPTRTASGTATGVAPTAGIWAFTGIEDWQASTSDSAFAGGTKQDADCPSVITQKADNKADLKRIYIASTTATGTSGSVLTGDIILTLAWVRIPQNTTSPSAHIAFEFNQNSTACSGSGHDDLVPRSTLNGGDMLIVYDFEGGSTANPSIKLERWVSSGSCEISTHSPPCWGTAVDLTAGGFAEAKVNTASTASDDLAPPALSSTTGESVTDSLGINEFGEAAINLSDPGVNVFPRGTPTSCTTFGQAFGVSRTSGNSGTAQMKDLVGPAKVNISNCGTVIIHKVTDPTGDTTTNFGYTTNVSTLPSATTSAFTIVGEDTHEIDNIVSASGRNVTEDDPGPGYELTDIDCSASTVPSGNISTDTTTRAVTFSIAGGETLECTFTNTQQTGAIKILKKSTKTVNLVNNAGAVFSYDNGAGSSGSVTDDQTAAAPDEDAAIGSVCVSGLVAGATYTVNETSPPTGYGAASQTDQSAVAAAGTNCTSNLPTGSGVVTFTNAPLADVQVRFRDGGSGETTLDAPLSCTGAGVTGDTTGTTDWDSTLTFTGVKAGAAPVTITCTIKIDP